MPRESCFEDDEYDLMKQCWRWNRSERITFPKIAARLKEMNAAMKTAGARCSYHRVRLSPVKRPQTYRLR